MTTQRNDLPTLSVDLVRAALRSEEFSGDKSEDGLRRAVERYLKWLRPLCQRE
jgi:hypothetical protein